MRRDAIGCLVIAILGITTVPARGEIVLGTESGVIGNGTLVQPIPCPTSPRYVAFAKLSGEMKAVFIHDSSTGKIFPLIEERQSEKDLGLFTTKRKASGPSFEGDLAWCPTLRRGDPRSWFVLVSNAGQAAPGLWLQSIGPDGLGVRTRLTDPKLVAVQPRWSPDGRMLAFVAHTNNNFNLFVLNDISPAFRPKPRLPVARQLTSEAGRESNAAWCRVGGKPFLLYERATQEGETGICWTDITGGPNGVIVDKPGAWELLPSPEPGGGLVAYYIAESGSMRDGQEVEGTYQIRLAEMRLRSDGGIQAADIQSPLAPYLVEAAVVRSEVGPCWFPRGRLIATFEQTGVKKPSAASQGEQVPLVTIVDTKLWRDSNASYAQTSELKEDGVTFPRDLVPDPLNPVAWFAAQRGQFSVIGRLDTRGSNLAAPRTVVFEQYDPGQVRVASLWMPGHAASFYDHPVRAWVMRGGVVAGVAGVAVGVVLARAATSDAETAVDRYAKATNPVDADQARFDWVDATDRYDSAKGIAMIAGGLAAAAYLYNLVDAWVLEGTPGDMDLRPAATGEKGVSAKGAPRIARGQSGLHVDEKDDQLLVGWTWNLGN